LVREHLAITVKGVRAHFELLVGLLERVDVGGERAVFVRLDLDLLLEIGDLVQGIVSLRCMLGLELGLCGPWSTRRAWGLAQNRTLMSCTVSAR
jgi:hypothetical protein